MSKERISYMAYIVIFVQFIDINLLCFSKFKINILEENWYAQLPNPFIMPA